MSGRVAHFDAVTGAAGDMIVAALVDAGAPLDVIRRGLAELPLPELRIETEEVRLHGFRALRLRVQAPDQAEHRHLPEVKRILAAGKLPADVVRSAHRVFDRLAEAEARSHGIPVERVHFHEVGALDAIVDVAAACLALRLLDVGEVTFSPLGVGGGEVTSAHGRLPVPVPAVVELTRGVPIIRGGASTELLTPTGAAILTTLGRPAPAGPFVAEASGAGAGTRDLPDRANVLRVSIGRWVDTTAPVAGPPGTAADTAAGAASGASWQSDEVVVLETNIDDMTPEALPAVLERAFAAGALDAFLTPVVMKKGRPAHVLTVLAEPPRAAALAEVIFRETSTFGVRRTTCPRWKLPRESREIDSPWGPVRIKVGDLGGGALRVAPEYESCRAIAERTGIPLREVYREVERLLRETTDLPRESPR